MTETTETSIRAAWVIRLWHLKGGNGGFDSPEEFMESGLCFACGMDPSAALVERNINNAERPHLLCAHCDISSSRLTGFSYWRWFLKRSAVDTIAADMIARVAKVWAR